MIIVLICPSFQKELSVIATRQLIQKNSKLTIFFEKGMKEKP